MICWPMKYTEIAKTENFSRFLFFKYIRECCLGNCLEIALIYLWQLDVYVNICVYLQACVCIPIFVLLFLKQYPCCTVFVFLLCTIFHHGNCENQTAILKPRSPQRLTNILVYHRESSVALRSKTIPLPRSFDLN